LDDDTDISDRFRVKPREVDRGKGKSYDRTTPEFKAAFARSKFNNIPDFPTWPDGHILLQEHGSVTYFRNIKIRMPPDN